MSRDRVKTPIPRAVTPRDEQLARALEEIRAQGGEWTWARTLLDEHEAQREEIEALKAEIGVLKADKASRDGLFRKLKGWIAGGWFVAAAALCGGIYDYGTRAGRSEASEAEARDTRRQAIDATATNHRQDADISVLRAVLSTLERTINRYRDGD